MRRTALVLVVSALSVAALTPSATAEPSGLPAEPGSRLGSPVIEAVAGCRRSAQVFGSAAIVPLSPLRACLPQDDAHDPLAWPGISQSRAPSVSSAPSTGHRPDGAAQSSTLWPPTCTIVAGYNDRCTRWQELYTEPASHVPPCVALNVAYAQAIGPDSVYIAGYTCDGQHGGPNATIAAYNIGDGTLRWDVTHNGAWNGWDRFLGVAVSPDGGTVYVTGLVDYGRNAWDLLGDMVTAAYDAVTGERRWIAVYDGPAFQVDQGMAVTVSEDGQRVYATGTSPGTPQGVRPGSFDFVTISYSAASGEQEWVARYDATLARDDVPFAIATRGSSVYVYGQVHESTPWAYDLAMVAYRDDRAAGRATQLWSSTYDDPSSDPFFGSDQVATPAMVVRAQDVVVAGTNAGGLGAYTIGFDRATGARSWTDRLGSDGTAAVGVVMDVASSPDGATAYVTSASYDDLGAAQIEVAAYGSGGDRRWTAPYSFLGEYVFPFDAAPGPGGGMLYVSGIAWWGGGFSDRIDALLVAIRTADGSVSWVGRSNPLSGESPSLPPEGPTQTWINSQDFGQFVGAAPEGGTVVLSGTFSWEPYPRALAQHGIDGEGEMGFGVVAYSTD